MQRSRAARNFWRACNVQRTTRSATNGSRCTTVCDLRHAATANNATRSDFLLLLGLYAFSSVDQRRGVVLPQQGQYTYPVVGNLPLLRASARPQAPLTHGGRSNHSGCAGIAFVVYVVIVYMSRTTCPLVFALALAACAIHAAIRKPSTALAPPCNEVHFFLHIDCQCNWPDSHSWDLRLRVRTALLTGHDCRLFSRQIIGYGMHGRVH